ncbi:MAG TPA: RnfH family protein [Candidatus Sulfotelmatobacter sp.]|jgi:putative ubiquitin-RnfH superfamily antitoxin RatB of RatAB toxin-antitoxin module|nr:RnfH family protein [Candidatus Sulfotelmatobacter sp.]
MKVGVVYATPQRQMNLSVSLDDGATVRQAIDRSGLLTRCPEIDLAAVKIGVWGKMVDIDSVVEDGARIEVYRPITADPRTVKRRNQPAQEG